MNRNLRSGKGSSIYAKIAAARLPESHRRNALEALSTAELLVDGAMWVARKLGELWGHLFLKPSVKH